MGAAADGELGVLAERGRDRLGGINLLINCCYLICVLAACVLARTASFLLDASWPGQEEEG